jgi:hypothetical protein
LVDIGRAFSDHDPGEKSGHEFCHWTVTELKRAATVGSGLFKPLWEGVVQTAEVRISDDDFGQRLKDMRLWLDRRRFEPSAFTYFYLDPGMMVRVCFDVDYEARAFAEEFGGTLIKTRAAVLAA